MPSSASTDKLLLRLYETRERESTERLIDNNLLSWRKFWLLLELVRMGNQSSFLIEAPYIVQQLHHIVAGGDHPSSSFQLPYNWSVAYSPLLYRESYHCS